MIRPVPLALALVLAAPSAAAAQVDPFVAPPLHVLEVTTRSRWLHEAQHSAATPYTTDTDRIRVRHRPPSNALANRIYTLEGGSLEGSMSVDAGGVVSTMTVVPPGQRYELDRDEVVDGMRYVEGGGRLDRGWIGLRGTRVWELPFPLPARTIAPGLTWTDTVSITTESGRWSRERLYIAWSLAALGDTLLGGQRLPVVQVRGEVDFDATRPVRDAARTEPLRVERSGAGWVSGRVVVDTALGLRAAGIDTLVVEGTSTLVMQDGRRFTEPARFERIRAFALRDSAAWDAEQNRRRAERRRTRGGMIRVAREAVADAGLHVDSLWARWASAVDPDERQAVQSRIALRTATDTPWTAFGTELRRRRLALGDSAGILESLPGVAGAPHALTLSRWHEIAPFLHDPARAWRWGMAPVWTYAGLANAFLGDAPGDLRDACTADACEAVLTAMAASPEPRLREVAAVARFVLDPAGAWDRLLALRDSGSTVVDGAIVVGQGIGATWPAAPKAPVPEAGADWREWLSWMGGSVRFQRSHARALRFYGARTGRDPLSDLTARWPDLETDSARLAVGTVLREMDRLAAPSLVDLRAALLGDSGPAAQAARRELDRLRHEADTIAAAEAAPFLGPILDSMRVAGRPPWAAAAHLDFLPVLGQGFHGAPDQPLLVSEAYLPPGLLDGRPVTAVDSATWAARDPRAGAVRVTFAPARRAGDLVYLSWSWTAWFDREPDEVPEGYAGGGSLWLARTDDGWVVVQVGQWIT